LGIGGFGITYLAHDSKLGARVAIKEYFPQDLASRNARMTIVPNPGNAARDYEWGRQQFLKEAQALARFKHNNIVRVLRFLELNGTAYMVMEYEKGQSLLEYMQSHGQPDERMLLQIFLPVLNGLQAVHSTGLLHLDIKPDNIYLRADGQPMLIDFGSARHTARGPDAGERIALTPAYAAIEQYPDKGKQGPWTDIYSIGASLYRCITGGEPVDALSRYQSILKYKADPLTPAAKLEKSGYSAYLRECIDWAMQIYPSHRPQGAIELQEALMGKRRPGKEAAQPVVAPKPGPSTPRYERKEESVRRTTSSFNLWKLTQFVVVALVIAGGVFVYDAYQEYSRRPRPAPVAAQAPAKMAPAPSAPSAQTPLERASMAERAAEISERPVFYRDNPVKLVRSIDAHQGPVESLAFLANGAQLASASEDGAIKIWDVQSGKLVRTLQGHRRSVHAIAVSPDGRLLVSAGNESELLLWDPQSGKRTGSLVGHDHDVYAMAFSPDGRLLASGGRDRTIILWDMNKRRPARKLEGHEDLVLTLAFSPNGKWLLSGGKNGELKRWDVGTGREIESIDGLLGLVSAARYSPDGKWFATASGHKAVRLWDVQTGQQQQSMAEAPEFVSSLAFTPDGKELIAGGSDRTVHIWDAQSGSVDQELAGHQGDVQAVALSPDRKTIASGGNDKTIRIWRAEVR
jgi:WD40 repeat protein